MLVATALVCLSMNIYHEARSEPIMGQYAVAIVTMNRAGNDDANVCKEVFRPSQFSWANNRATKTKDGWVIARGLMPREQDAWDRANRVALQVLARRTYDYMGWATHYHATHVKPFWAKAGLKKTVIGRHVFYSIA